MPVQPAPDAIAAFAASNGLTLDQFGAGRPVLLLHGGAGPTSVAAFAQRLAARHLVLVPTHPGFAQTPQHDDQRSIKQLATLYAGLLDAGGLADVLVIGSSIGGWIAAELAVLAPARVAGYVLVDAVGITVPGETVLDVFTVPPAELPRYSFHAPAKFAIDPATLGEAQKATMAANRAALAVYGGALAMQDPDLAARLAGVTAPALVVWGDSDGVVRPDYGRAFAAAFPNGRFDLIAACGHLPQLEQPEALERLVEQFAADLPRRAVSG